MRVLYFILSFFLPTFAHACGVALALAVDVSGSVDPQEYRLQMLGLAEALRDSAVSEALVREEAAVMLVQWTGSGRQEVTIPWTRLSTFSDTKAFARQVEAAPRRWRNFSTAIGDALEFTLAQWQDAPRCRRNIIDVSGDGPSNEGRAPRDLHPALADLDITVNALAIEASEPDLTAYFYTDLIRGEGAFVVTAATFKDYPKRIRQKLLREVTEQVSLLD